MQKAIPKIKAGALQFVLFIAVVIALLLMSFVLLGHTHHFFGKKTELLVEMVKSNDVALRKALDLPLALGDSTSLIIDENGGINHKAIRDFWGVYEKYSIVSKTTTNNFTKVALIGTGVTEKSPALYLQDNDRPMIIVGKAKITGIAFLPKQGIKAGNISGYSYQGNSLIYGQQKRSGEQLPRLDTEFLGYLNQHEYGVKKMNKNQVLDFTTGMQQGNSFKKPTQYIVGNTIEIRKSFFAGNIIIQAERRIRVGAESKLEDVILIAPEIEIADGVVGTFQAIATKYIRVGRGCRLQYPSALVVKGSKPTKKELHERQPNIFIGEGSQISGVVLYTGNFEDQKFMPQIKLAKTSSLLGQLYCTQNLELKGNVEGSVYTYSLVALENGSIYQNHLYQGTINSGFLPTQYAGLPLRNQKKANAKWLY